MREATDTVLRVGGEMSIASVRGRAARTQLLDWAARLRRVAEILEDVARGH